MNNISYSDSKVSIICPSNTPLPDLSFALEFASNNLVGRGIYRFGVERRRGDGGSCIVEISSLMAEDKSRPMLVSQVIRLGDAIHQGVIPDNIPIKESFRLDIKGEVKPARDGQHRSRQLFSFTQDDTGWADSVVESHDINPHMPLGVLSFGFADMSTGLFALGVKNIKYQISRKMSQIYVHHRFSEAKLVAFFKQEGNDYPLDMTVGKLP